MPDQLRAIRSEIADLTDLMLDIANAMSALREQPVEQAPPPPPQPVAAEPPAKKPSVRSKKAIEFVSANFNSIEAIARDMELPVDVTYRKLYYLQGKDEVELRRGECRLKPKKPALVRAEA